MYTVWSEEYMMPRTGREENMQVLTVGLFPFLRSPVDVICQAGVANLGYG